MLGFCNTNVLNREDRASHRIYLLWDLMGFCSHQEKKSFPDYNSEPLCFGLSCFSLIAGRALTHNIFAEVATCRPSHQVSKLLGFNCTVKDYWMGPLIGIGGIACILTCLKSVNSFLVTQFWGHRKHLSNWQTVITCKRT